LFFNKYQTKEKSLYPNICSSNDIFSHIFLFFISSKAFHKFIVNFKNIIKIFLQ